MRDFNYKNLSPFKWYVLENFPYIEADFDALTDWQLFCKLGKELNKVINNLNSIGTQTQELTDFVINYFDNLDVQEEINNKLNEMAQDGTLQEIITAYLRLKCIYGFDNIASMRTATNLIEGSFARTYSQDNINDGKGGFYKVRRITSGDVVDNIKIVALYDNTLIAEKMNDYDITNIKENITNIEENINTIQTNIITPVGMYKNKNLVVIGDSFSAPDIPNSEYEHWINRVIEATGMIKYNFAVAGAGFGREGNLFSTQLTTAINAMTSEQKIKTGVVIVYGGYNDLANDVNDTTIVNNAILLVQNIQTNFPNAKIILAPFNWGFGSLSKSVNRKIQEYINRIERGISNKPCTILKLARYWNLGIHSFFRNSAHPSEEGYNNIASFMLGAIYGNSEHVGFGEYLIPLHGNSNICVYDYNDGLVTFKFGVRFDSELTTYSGTQFDDLPPLLIPETDILIPLKDINANDVGILRLSNDGKGYIKIKNLPANTYAMASPITFNAEAWKAY